MMVVWILVVACLLSLGRTAGAQDAPPPKADPTAVELLDEVPNYAEILASQWSSGVPLKKAEIGRSGSHFGRLIEAGPVEGITLQESIALALQNNTGLKIQRLSPISATAEVRNARSIFDPQFFGNVAKTRQQSPVGSVSQFTSTSPTLLNQDVEFGAGLGKTLLSGGQLALEWTNHRFSTNPSVINQLVPRYETTLDLSLNQPLLRDFGWRYALLLVEVAQNTEEQAYYQYRASIATLVKDVERAYWALVLAIENVKVTEQGLELAKELLRQNEGRYNVGALPRTAVLEAQAEVAAREAGLVLSRNLQQNARDNLRAIINYRQPGADALLMIEPSDRPAVEPYEINLERSLQSATERRPELIAARLDVKGKRLLRKVAENQLLPRLDFVGSIGLNGLGGRDAGQTSEFSQPNPQVLGGYDRSLELLTDGRFYQYVAGATIEVPIANAQAKAEYAQAKVATEQSWLSLYQLEENVTLEVKQVVSDLESDLRLIEATRIARELAEENLRNQKARYDVGLATTKDLLDFQDRLTQSRREEIVSLTKYNTDLAEMRRVDGSLLRERGVIVERNDPERPSWWARF